MPSHRSLLWLILSAVLISGGLSCYVLAELAPDAVLADGGRYFGPLENGRLHGEGRLAWDNGARYQGGFERGLKSGQGRLELPDGHVYQGAFRLGMFHGEGRMLMPDGGVYEGGFAAGAFHGEGRYVGADGQVYEGRFEAGQPVHARYRGEGGEYDGGFENWRLHGEGRYTDPAGNIYVGHFDGADLSGPARVEAADGSLYQGELKNWRFHGHGILELPSGDRYEGEFENGFYHGQGTLSYARPREGVSEIRGAWRWGEPVGRRQDGPQPAERALYVQAGLLEQALAGLLQQDPERIDMYLLAVAGDGRQEVFRREVEYVRELFDREFGTADRSLTLVNSRSTVESTPMATVHSLRESLSAISARLDPEQDILFLFLTSHGSPEHELTLAQQGMRLQGLSATELAELLADSGIRWRVVVVSACYSGGFVEHLADPHTLVITAASAERTSFGCTDENEFTYFGRAFFKEALPDAESLPDAFARAVALVKEWEAAEDYPHSEPQIDSPEAILEQLARWRAQFP